MPAKLKLSFSKTSPKGDVTTICLIGKNAEIIPRLEKNIAAHLIRTMALAQFTGKSGKSLMIYTDINSYLLIGTGDKLGAGTEAETLGGQLFSALNGTASKLGWMPDHKLAPTVLADILFGANLASYHFDRYFTEKDRDDVSVRLCVGGEALSEKVSVYRDRQALANGVFLARDLVFEPANKLYPVEFANRCTDLTSLGLEVEVLDEDAMEKLGMGALLGVGQGSRRESRMVVMNWRGGGDESPFAFVGKGVTFDTGGISLKPPKGMEDMKWDMGGAAVVSGLMKALAGRKAKANVVGVVGLVENMPDGEAQRPGDVVTSMSGQTIEIINTDAEGRLVLADALWYTNQRFKPKFMINLATLTGAMLVALGQVNCGYFSNDDTLSSQLDTAASVVGEGVWRMPLGEEYNKMMDSDIADMKNAGPRFGGSITAACFLERFVEKCPWSHMDIAGMAWSSKDAPTVPKGGTGWGVRTLNQLVKADYELN